MNLVKLTEINAQNNLESKTITENVIDKSSFDDYFANFSGTFYTEKQPVSSQKEPLSIPPQTIVSNSQSAFQGSFKSLAPVLTQLNQLPVTNKTVNAPQSTNIAFEQNINAIAMQLIEANGKDPAKMIEILNTIDTSKLSSVDAKELLKVVDYINNVKNIQPNSINKPYSIAINYPNSSMLENQPVTYVLNHMSHTTTMYQSIINNLAYVNSQMISGQK